MEEDGSRTSNGAQPFGSQGAVAQRGDRRRRGLCMQITALNVCFGSALPFSQRNCLKKLLVEAGGCEAFALNDRTTHLVSSAPSLANERKIRQAGALNIPIVTPAWLTTCCREGRVLPTTDFAVDEHNSSPSPHTIPISPFSGLAPWKATCAPLLEIPEDSVVTAHLDAPLIGDGFDLLFAGEGVELRTPVNAADVEEGQGEVEALLYPSTNGTDEASDEHTQDSAAEEAKWERWMRVRVAELTRQREEERAEEERKRAEEAAAHQKREEAQLKESAAAERERRERERAARRVDRLKKVAEGWEKEKLQRSQQAIANRDNARQALKERRKREKDEKKARRRAWLARQKESGARREAWAAGAEGRDRERERWEQRMQHSTAEKGRKLFVGNVATGDLTEDVCGSEPAVLAEVEARTRLLVAMFARWGAVEGAKGTEGLREKGFMFILFRRALDAERALAYLSVHANRVAACEDARRGLLKQGLSPLPTPSPKFYVRMPRAELCDAHPDIAPPAADKNSRDQELASEASLCAPGSVDAVFAAARV